MSKLKLNMQNSIFKICVDNIENNIISGYIWSQRLKKEIPFFDIGGLILEMEHVMDIQDYPQAFQKSREFQKNDVISFYAAENQLETLSKETVYNAKGKLLTFEIFVEIRLNSSWQGKITIKPFDETFKFQSALELMLNIDELIKGLDLNEK